VTDQNLQPIRAKVLAGEPLSYDDGVALYRSRDIHGIGRSRTSCGRSCTAIGRTSTVIVISTTRTSARSVASSALSTAKRGEAGAYEMPVEQVIATAKKAADAGATEVHIVGGLHPWLKFDYYLEMLRGIRSECPSLHIKAFTAIEIVHFTRIARMSIRDVLSALRDAGLGSLPGGGAEIFDDRVHDEVFKGKVGANKWFEVHRTAHELGIYSNATMLYGHVERPEERVGHLIKLRELQSESLNRGVASFNCVIPLSFIPEDSELGALPGPTGLTDLKTLAIARLMLNNIAHIKAFWIMQGIGLSQLALSYGCDDLDGTVVWYDITKREGDRGTTHQEMHVEQMKRLIRDAGRTPIERDTLYREIVRSSLGEPALAGV
jgi:aminodeoxyfutalosine synthase